MVETTPRSAGADRVAQIRERLFTSVIGDVMDKQGLRQQFLPPHIRALSPEMKLVGRAMPVREEDCTSQGDFGLMFKALDDLQKGEVYICTGASPRYALWGELMSTRARALGAAGAVVDGFHRDTSGILEVGLPVFSAGSYAQDQRGRGRVIDFRREIRFANGTIVAPGDIIVGDRDGVLVIPKAHLDKVVEAAIVKVEGEEEVRRLIEKGEGTQAIFDRTGIM
ncbi:MAG: RraA family protein [Hyphomicrobiales bacterium]|nr:RraA family protein [Hyphomicrobiales bacterium]MBV8429089.1 RraA family protein [Hyphomicrobiales bacterium]